MMAGQNKSFLYDRQNYQKISIGKLENTVWKIIGFRQS